MLVATSSKTLVVNPAFLQEIKDSNPDLWGMVIRLEQVCRCEDETVQVLRQLTRLLDELRDQLALHFSLEESYGYIEVPGCSSRVIGQMAGKAQAEHGILYLRLSDLAEQAEELQYRGVEPVKFRELVERSIEFYDDLNRHESLEKELIRRSYDLG